MPVKINNPTRVWTLRIKDNATNFNSGEYRYISFFLLFIPSADGL